MTSSPSLVPETAELDIDNLLVRFRKSVEIKDRKYRLSTYKKCFVGSDAVQWLVTSGTTETREDAVRVGQTLVDSGYIEHCVREHAFKDEGLFYRFIEDTDRGAVAKRGNHAVSWADFLSPSSDMAETMQPRLPSSDAVPDAAVHAGSQTWPKDEHNVKLLDNVHPAEWIDPVFDGVYNLVVIGAGAAGLIAAGGAAGVGAKVALIEANALGGDCLNVGCVPSKALIHAANVAESVRNQKSLAEYGITIKGEVDIDFAQTMRRLRKIRADISKADSATRYTKELGVDVYLGYAKFTSEKTVVVNGKKLEFRRAVIATGGYPSIPKIPGLKELHEIGGDLENGEAKPHVMTNETFFNMTEQPRTLGVIGTGVIGMELAQAMQRLGTKVTMFGRSGTVLPKEDGDLANLVKKQMEADGVDFRLTVSEYKNVELSGEKTNGMLEMLVQTVEDGVDIDYKFDAILVAAGRLPNVTGMDLEKANVKYDTRAGVKVSDTLQTTNPKIFAAGDVCSQFKFTHAADGMARIVIRNALFFGTGKVSKLLIPYATFTTPELAHVGLYESDLKDRNIAYKTFEKSFEHNDRAITDSSTTGMVRVHVDAKSDVILGASILGANAGNMISEITLAMQSNTGLQKLSTVIHPYPTTAQAVQAVGDLYNKTRLTSTVRGLLRGIVSIQR